MSSYARSMSTRLYVQAAITGLLAPLRPSSHLWLGLTFVLAIAAAAVASVVRTRPERARELVIGFEAVAVVVGVAGVLSQHYIPGTIVGIAALITAVSHPAPAAPAEAVAAPTAAAEAVPAQAGPADADPVSADTWMPPLPTVPAQPVPAIAHSVMAEPVMAEPAIAEPVPAAVVPVQPVAIEAPAPPQPAKPAFDPTRTAARAETILPGRA